jgi:hypothetical protein
MSPALIRYATSPKPRLVRYFLIGVAAGLGGLYAGHVALAALDDTQPTTYVYSRGSR